MFRWISLNPSLSWLKNMPTVAGMISWPTFSSTVIDPSVASTHASPPLAVPTPVSCPERGRALPPAVATDRLGAADRPAAIARTTSTPAALLRPRLLTTPAPICNLHLAVFNSLYRLTTLLILPRLHRRRRVATVRRVSGALNVARPFKARNGTARNPPRRLATVRRASGALNVARPFKARNGTARNPPRRLATVR